MIDFTRKKLEGRPVLADLVNALFFGVMSILFGYVKIRVPDFEGISADFREIPLLISIFYLRSWWPIFIMCAVTVLTPSSVDNVTVFTMHFAGLIFAWVMYHKVLNQLHYDKRRGVIWALICTVYYVLFIIPLLILIGHWVNPKGDLEFLPYFVNIFELVKYEFIVTTLVTSMYLLQFDARNKLMEHERKLESEVEDRTNKLATANYKLKILNENLDELAIARSKKIREQLDTIEKYANMNSHQLRAPLSNILGLVNLLRSNNHQAHDKEELLKNLDKEAVELDDIIKEMNEILEKEMKFHSDNPEMQ